MAHNADVQLLERLTSEIRAGRVKVYRNLLGEPYIFCDLPHEQRDRAMPALHVGIHDSDFKAWLALFAWQEQGAPLNENQIERVINVLSGMSLRDKTADVTDTALLRLLEEDAMLAAIAEFMRVKRQPRIEMTMEQLWKSLRKFAKRHDLLRRGKSRFPGGANVLSRRLRESKALLERLSIRVTIARSNGSKVVLERLDDSPSEPSAESNSPNTRAAQDLAATDDRQAILSFLRLRQNSQTAQEGKRQCLKT